MAKRKHRKRRGHFVQKSRAVGASTAIMRMHEQQRAATPHNVTIVHRPPNAIDLLRREQPGDPPVVVR